MTKRDRFILTGLVIFAAALAAMTTPLFRPSPENTGQPDERADAKTSRPKSMVRRLDDRREQAAASTPAGRALRMSSEEERREYLSYLRNPERFPHGARHAIEALFLNWFEADPEKALEALETIEDPNFRGACLEQGIPAFADDPAELARLHDEYLEDRKASRRFAIACFDHLGRHNPPAALELLDHPAMRYVRRNAIEKTFDSWMSEPHADIGAVLDAAASLPTERETLRALHGAFQVRSWPEQGATPRLVDFARIHRLTGGDSPPDNHRVDTVRENAFEAAVIPVIRNQGIGRLFDQLESGRIPLSEQSKRTVIDTHLARTERSQDLETSLEVLRASPVWKEGEDEHLIAREIASGRSPYYARRFVDNLADTNPGKPAAVRQVMWGLLHYDFHDATEWVDSMPAGEIRDAALAPLVRVLEREGREEQAADWRRLRSNNTR